MEVLINKVYNTNEKLLLTKNRINHTNPNINIKSKNTEKSKNTGISIKTIQLITNDTINENLYSLPKKLVDKVENICQIEFSKYFNNQSVRSQNVYKNKLQQALYFFIAIKDFNYLKNKELHNITDVKKIKEINFKYDVQLGNQLSKEILTNVIVNRDLYKIKKILIKYELIGNVPLNTYIKYNMNGEILSEYVTFYSKNKKQALHYFINPQYLDDEQILLKNKYADKHAYLLKHLMLFGNIKKCLNENYLPYKNIEKNIQYKYQKNMYVDINLFHKKLLEKFPELTTIKNVFLKLENNDISEIKNLSNYIDILSIYRTMQNFNKHIFHATEAHGRIFMPLQCIPSIFRECIKYGNNKESIIELFDMKCCFIQLAGRLALSKEIDIFKRNEYIELIKLAKIDIYTKILNFINNKELTRNDIKNQIMQWLFCTNNQRLHNKNKVFHEISFFFKNNFPNFYNFITTYNLCLSNNLLKNKKRKIISKLSIDCFQYESQLMFNYVLPTLHKKYLNIPFFSLHDSIWSTQSSLKLLNLTSNDLYKQIEHLIDSTLNIPV